MTGRRGGQAASDDGTVNPGVPARLRAMVPADLVDVIALEHSLFPEDPWTPEMFADEVAQPPESRLYLIAEADAGDGGVVDGDIVSGRGAECGRAMAGYAGLMFIPGGKQADVLTIAVRPAYWGQGIGSALLGALLDAARDRGCTEVFLEVRADNPRAHGLYRRRGFEELGVRRGYYQPSGVDAIVMRKDLLR
ncbi:MAG TPA: ribosomal protein S18-alanine N-acetyltransferase [Trebonia sp.]|jgi:ribosomal-protein-alanine N-acetyltransferase